MRLSCVHSQVSRKKDLVEAGSLRSVSGDDPAGGIGATVGITRPSAPKPPPPRNPPNFEGNVGSRHGENGILVLDTGRMKCWF